MVLPSHSVENCVKNLFEGDGGYIALESLQTLGDLYRLEEATPEEKAEILKVFERVLQEPFDGMYGSDIIKERALERVLQLSDKESRGVVYRALANDSPEFRPYVRRRLTENIGAKRE
ncbi:unnamed protein product, partial [marine sediment metagenome]